MATVLKYPKNNQKGIIIFTHKEILWYFSRKDNQNRFKKSIKKVLERNSFLIKKIKDYRKAYARQNNSKNLKVIEFKPFIEKEIVKLKENYFIGMHLGGYIENIPTTPYVDFLMLEESLVDSKRETFQIPLTASHFTPSFFSIKDSKAHNKYWDIICVAHNSHVKKLDLFLKEIQKIYKLGYPFKVLLVVPTSYNQDSNKFYNEIIDDYYKMFTHDERMLFTILKLHPDLSFLGISQKQLSFFYHSSKVFTLFSQEEGGSRVLSEAVTADLMVVAKNDLKGGGLDKLDPANSVLFNKYEEAHKSLVYAVNNYNKKGTNTEKKQKLLENNSIVRLKNYLKELYEINGETYDRKLDIEDNLNLRLPGHYYENIPWMLDRFQTTDVLTKKQFNILIENL